MSPTSNEKPSNSPDLVTRRDTAAGQVHSPLASPRPDTTSPSLSVKKESLDDDRRASTRTSGSARTSVVDDHTGVDPLSLHILKRTGTEAQLKYRGSGTIPGDEGMRSRQGSVSLHPEPAPSESAATAGVKAIAHAGRGILGEVLGNENGHKKKGSLLTRIMGGKDSDESDDDSAENLKRTEGLDAQAFSAPLGAGAAPAPPKYIRVSSLPRQSLVPGPELFCPANIRTSKSSSGTKSSAKNGPFAPDPQSGAPNALPRHKTGAIWSMKFSRDGKYLAAGGQDMIVRVWSLISTREERNKHEKVEEAAGTGEGTEYHQGKGLKLNAPVFMSEPLHEFAGHTADVLDLSWSKNNFLLSSSMDKTVRLWHVTKKECLCCFQHSDFVTAIAFHPRDDRFFLSGSLDCKLRLWSIPDKQVAFWNELPELITAVAFTPDGKFSIAGSFVGLCLFYETDGLRYHTQIHVRSTRGRNSKGSKITGIQAVSMPTGSAHGEVKLLITSNDSRVRMYNFRDKSLEVKFKGNMNTCSQIHATFSDTGKYVVCGSEDRKVYIWNGTAANNSKRDKRGYEYFEAHSTIVTVAIFAPSQSRHLLAQSGDPVYQLCSPPLPPPPLTHTASTASTASQVSTAQGVSQTAFHADGNIIVSADYTGQIKVFRQDCAWSQRKADNSDTASIRLRKSNLARGSTSSIRPSGMLALRSNTVSSRAGSTRSSSRRNSTDAPSLPTNSSQTTLAKNLEVPKAGSVDRANGRGASPSPTRGRKSTTANPTATQQDPNHLTTPSPERVTRQKSTVQERLMLQEDGQSLAFYHLPAQRRDDSVSDHSASLSPIRRGSISSGHSSEGMDDEARSFVDAEERLSSSDDMVCKNCGARTFNAFKVQNGPLKGETKLRCSVCKHVYD